jgi:glycosyltransferase involved in cell wall biosynthesis
MPRTRLALAESVKQGDAAKLATEVRALLADDAPAVIVGTVCERKGQIDVVRALPQLPAALRARVRCFIVGDRPSDYSNAVAAAIAALGDGLSARVVTVPETPDVVLYYRAADVFVCASRMECYPRVTQEAMALGLPMVTTPVFGIFERGLSSDLYEGTGIGLAIVARAMQRMDGAV